MSRDLAKWPAFTSLQKEMSKALDDFFGNNEMFLPGNYPLLDIDETNESIIVKTEFRLKK